VYLLIACFSVFIVISSRGFSTIDDRYGIPLKIWQTYRTKDLPRPAADARSSWIQENPDYQYCFMDDIEIEEYVLKNWDCETFAFFKSLPIGVMKADLWRYLIITHEGGVYSDIDSICCLPIDYWLLYLGGINQLPSGQPLLFLGIEEDNDKEVIDFCQWTFMATPKHPAMEFACRYILDHWKKNGMDLTSKNFVHQTTGPTILKHALMTYLDEPISMRASDLYKKYIVDKNLRKKLHARGVYLLSKVFYNGFASVHLVGSTNFKEGYVSWAEEVNALQSHQRDLGVYK